MTFKQNKWLEEYVRLNTKYGAEVKNDFERNQCKLLNNLVFGETIQNKEVYDFLLMNKKEAGLLFQ